MNVVLIANSISMHENFNKTNIKVLLSLGCKIHLVSNDKLPYINSLNRLLQFKEFCDSNDITIHNTRFLNRNPYRIDKLIRAYFEILRIIRDNNINFIHSHSPVGGLLGRIVASRYQIRNFYTVHGFHFYKGAPLINWIIYYPIEKFLSSKTSLLLTINEEDTLIALSNFKTKLAYIPGIGISINNYKTRQSSDTKYIKFVSLGELNNNKNHLMVLKALSLIDSKVYHYYIAGDGPNKKKLVSFAKSHGLSNNITFLGYVEDVPKLLGESDVLIHPSIREGLPVAILEAMASGLAILASNIRGNNELVIDGKGGYLFKRNSYIELYGCIKRLFGNDNNLKGMGLYNLSAVKKYSETEVYNKLFKLYSKEMDRINIPMKMN